MFTACKSTNTAEITLKIGRETVQMERKFIFTSANSNNNHSP